MAEMEIPKPISSVDNQAPNCLLPESEIVWQNEVFRAETLILRIEQLCAENKSRTPLLELVAAHFSTDSGTLHLVKEDGFLHLEAHYGDMPGHVLNSILVIPIGKGMAGRVVEQKEAMVLNDLQKDNSGSVRPGAKDTAMKGAVVVPIMRDGEAVGALGIACSAERIFTPEDVELLMRVGRVIGEK